MKYEEESHNYKISRRSPDSYRGYSVEMTTD